MSKTNLSVSIETIDEKIRRYNESVCTMLADPQVLANILVNLMEEFSGWSIPDMIDAIGDIEIRKRYVNPGYSNLGRNVGDPTVDIVPGEGEIRYDIRFVVRYGDVEKRLLINIEAQNNASVSRLKYHIENRIQYYLARMMSAQKNTEFVNDNYDDIKKCVSIWICMDAKADEDSITKYSFKSDSLYGNNTSFGPFDKMEAYIVHIRNSENVEESKNKLINMLEIILSSKKKETVKKLLQDKHHMLMEIAETEKEVNQMCNLGEALYERALQEGLERGIEQGLERGIEQGIERGLEQGIERNVSDMIKKKLAKGKDIKTIANEIEETEERVKELIEKYQL